MASIECGRGHLYDPENYPVCPYCNTNQQITVRSAVRTAPVSVAAPQKTAPLSPGISVTSDNKTMPPRGYGRAAAPASDGKTAPPRGYGASVADSGKTVGVMSERMGFDPVVGWLACTEGPSRGKGYTVRSGINTIGRGDRMDIVVTGDMKISSENAAKISYSDKNNRFNLIPGDGKNIIYLNGGEVFSATVLDAYDVIDFGETKLMFVPLCGERFRWDARGGDDDGV